MNKATKAKMEKLVERCEHALRDKHQQSFSLWRGEMWAIVSAVHELRKRGVMEPATSHPARLTEAVEGTAIGSANDSSVGSPIRTPTRVDRP